MKDYSDFRLEDFLNDHDFKEWVYDGADLRATVWEQLLSHHPEKYHDFIEAKSIVLNWKNATTTLTEADRQEGIRSLMEEVGRRSWSPRQSRIKRFVFWKFAGAAAIVVVFLGWTLWRNEAKENLYSYEALVQETDLPLKEVVNNTLNVMVIHFPDSSKVTLNPESRLSYSKAFARDTVRRVILNGEAFFKVTRDVTRPFVVLSNGITTRVLGTSFRIRSDKKRVSVEVASGQVAVYRMDHSVKRSDTLLLSANYQAVFSPEENLLNKGLVDKPALLSADNSNNQFQFDETPLTTVLDVLQKAYGIEIIYDKEGVGGCNVTIPLNHESFYEKLDIICNTIHAKYKVIDNKVVITGTARCN